MAYDIPLDCFSTEPASEQQLEAAFGTLMRYEAKPHEERNEFSARWEDGSGFSLFSRSFFNRPILFHALLTPLGDLSQRFCDFAFELALEIDCAIYPDVIPPLTIITRPELAQRLPEHLQTKKVVRVSNSQELRHALAPSYYGWVGMVEDIAGRLNQLGKA